MGIILKTSLIILFAVLLVGCGQVAKSQEASNVFAKKEAKELPVSETLFETKVNTKYQISFLFFDAKIDDSSIILVKVRDDKTNQIKNFYSALEDNFPKDNLDYWSPDGNHFVFINGKTGGLFIYKTTELVKVFLRNDFSETSFLNQAKSHDRINILTDKQNPEFQLTPLKWIENKSILFSVNREEKDTNTAFNRKQTTYGQFRYDFSRKKLFRKVKSIASMTSEEKVVYNKFYGLLGENKNGVVKQIRIANEAF